MENIIQSLGTISKSIQPYISELKAFHFSYLNPVFLALILVSMLVLLKFWGLKKAFRYCLIVSLILFLTTVVNERVNFPLDENVFTSKDLINGASILVITIVTFLFTFLKD